MIRRTALSRTLAMSVLSAAIVLLVGWAVTAYTVDTGLGQLPREFSGIGLEAYREACNKNYWAPLEQLVIVRLKAMSVTGSALTGSMKVRVYSFFRIPWADVEVTWCGGRIRGMKTNRIFVSSAGEQATDLHPNAPSDLTTTSNGETTSCGTEWSVSRPKKSGPGRNRESCTSSL